jgi:hypothetical protein
MDMHMLRQSSLASARLTQNQEGFVGRGRPLGVDLQVLITRKKKAKHALRGLAHPSIHLP